MNKYRIRYYTEEMSGLSYETNYVMAENEAQAKIVLEEKLASVSRKVRSYHSIDFWE